MLMIGDELAWPVKPLFDRPVSKGGHPLDPRQGSGNSNSVLDEEKVREIKRRLKSRDPVRLIAAAFGVKKSTVYDIRAGKLWRHV